MKNHFVKCCLVVFIFSSCQKSIDTSVGTLSTDLNPVPTLTETTYTIFQGQQYSDKNTYLPVNLTELKFKVKFDSSAIYQTVASYNQGGMVFQITIYHTTITVQDLAGDGTTMHLKFLHTTITTALYLLKKLAMQQLE